MRFATVAGPYAALVLLAAAQLAGDDATAAQVATFVVAGIVAVGLRWVSPGHRWVIATLAAAGAALGIAAMVAFLRALPAADGPSGFYTVKVAVRTPLASHNVLASLLLVGVVASVLAGRGDRRWHTATVLCTLGLAATLSRGGALVLLVVGPAGWLVLRDRVVAAQVAAAGLAATLLVLVAAAGLGAAVPGGQGPTSVVSRTQLWSAALDTAMEHPVAGVGLDELAAEAEAAGVADPRDHAHNLLLHAAATTGIAGLLAVVVLWGGLAIRGWRRPEPALRALLLLGGGALGLHALIEETTFRPAPEILLAILIGMSLTRVAEPGAAASPR